MAGALQYLTLTHSDIIHVVKRILWYLKGIIDYGLWIVAQSSFTLFGFFDADWAWCPLTRRSTTGYCVFLWKNCISWASKKQPTAAHSSTEAKYRSFGLTATDLTWICYLLRDIGIHLSQSSTLFCDNISALYLTVNLVIHARTMHIEIDYHFVCEKFVIGALVTRFVSSSKQLTDVFIKPLPKDIFCALHNKHKVSSSPPLILRGSDKGRGSGKEQAK